MGFFTGVVLGVWLFFPVSAAFAGPPFLTDDPEPVEHRHAELYLASQFSHASEGTAVTLPHVEANYGLLPNMQIHLIAPLELVSSRGQASHYGYGDTELGIKYRFVKESDSVPMVGIFPLVEVPTGDESKGLGSGEVQVFLPVWFQKSWGPWTSYGGGGYWINPGKGNRNWGFVGWEVQRDLSKRFTLGGEIYHKTPSVTDGDTSTGFNLGAIINIDDLQHVLISAGRDFSGPTHAQFYVAYQLTFGP